MGVVTAGEQVEANGSSRPGPKTLIYCALIGLSVVLTGAVCFGALKRREVALFIYGKVSYWVVLALVSAWVWQIVRMLFQVRFSPVAFARRHWVPLAVALGLTTMTVSSVPAQYRVLSDETNLIGVSQAMLYHKTPYNNTHQKRYFGAMWPLSFEVEKRPLVFPFLVHLVHVVRGYSAQNAFALNVGVFFLLLALVGVAVEAKVGTLASVAAALLVGTYPLVAMTARSAGFDLLATFLTALCFVLAYLHMRQPSAGRLAVLAVTLMVFTQVRYESAIYAGIIVLFLLAGGYIRWAFIAEKVGLYALAPILMLPLVIQRILTPHPYENAAASAPFSFEHFAKNLRTFFAAQLDWDFLQPHVPALYWLALPIVAIAAGCLFRHRVSRSDKVSWQWLAIVVATLIVSHALLFSYYFGDFAHPASARFFLPLSVCVALLPIVLHQCLPTVVTSVRLLIAAVVFAIVFHPVSEQGRFTATQTLWRQSEIEWRFLAQRADPNVLVVNSRPGQITVMNHGAVSFDYARANSGTLLLELRRHLFSEILVFQRVSYQTGAAAPEDQLGPEFNLQVLAELQNEADQFVRVSRVAP